MGDKVGQGSESLISQVRALVDGSLVVPSIQRGYVWQRSQVPYLLDSLFRGYPIGALLVWKTNLDVPLRMAAVVQGTPTHTRPSVLLDGQQRLTSLAKVIDPAAVIGAALDVRFDLRDKTFLNPSAVQRRDPMLVRVTEVLGEAPQFAGVLERAGVDLNDPAYQTFYQRLVDLHGVRGYQVPIITVDSDDYEEVADIFARVNQGGRRLSKGDLVYSAIAARWSAGLDTIEAFSDELDRNYFSIDREAVLRLTGLLAGVGAHAIKLIGKEMTETRLKAAWADTERALRLVVDFLRGECGIPRAAVLTSPNVVVIPAYLLHQRSGRLSDEESSLLRRWVYTAMGFSHYSNQVEGKLDTEAKLTEIKTGRDLFDDLIRRASGPRSADSPISPDDLRSKGASSPLFNLLYIAALRDGARDWCSNTAISALPMTSTSSIEYHHVFPKARVMSRFGKDLTNGLANLAFISGACNRTIGAKLPREYLKGVHVDRLGEQHVSADAARWELDAFEDFLAERRVLLAGRLNRLLGLPAYVPRPAESPDAELPEDDDLMVDDDPGSESQLDQHDGTLPGSIIGGRRSVGDHIVAAFTDLPVGSVLVVRDIVDAGSSDYAPGEISGGAVAARLLAGGVPGIRLIPGSSPRAAEKVADA